MAVRRINRPASKEPPGLARLLGRMFASSRRDLEAELASIVSMPNQVHRVRRLRATISELERAQRNAPKLAKEWAQQAFPDVYGRGARQASSAMGASFSWTQFHRQAVGTVVSDTYSDVLRATKYESREVKKLVRSLGREQTFRALVEGKTPQRAGRDLARQFRSLGLDGITYRDGSVHTLKSYTEMLMRTKSATAFNFGSLQQYNALGVRFVEILDGDDCGLTFHEDPQRAAGLVLSVDWAWAWPISHPNCQRDFAPRTEETMPNAFTPTDEQIANMDSGLRELTPAARARTGRNERVPRGERTGRNERTPRNTTPAQPTTVLNGQVQVPPGVTVDVVDRGEFAVVDLIKVAESARGQGLGTAALRNLTEWADANGKVLNLTPDPNFANMNRKRLESFYRQFGFGKKRRDMLGQVMPEAWARYPTQ